MTALSRLISRTVQRFRASRHGSVATTFSLSMIPVIGLLGASVDFATVAGTRAKVQSIADAAALSAVAESVVKPTYSWEQQKIESEKIAKATFESLMSVAGLDGAMASATYEITLKNNAVIANVCFSGTQKTMAVAIAGFATMDFGGCAGASSAPPLFVSVYVLADASGSMGIGASTTDQTLMNSKLGCAFACHTLSWKVPMFNPDCKATGGWDDGRATPVCAKKIGAKTRFDIVRSALSDVIDEAGTMAKLPDQFRFAVYKFSNTLTEVQKESASLSTVKTAVNNMEMDVAGAGSNFTVAMKDLLKKIPASGDGKTAASPKVMLLLMTDGVEGNVNEYSQCKDAWVDGKKKNICNYWGQWSPDTNFTVNNPGFYWGSERSQAIDSKVCDGFKNKGITVATLNTEYITPPGSTDTRFVQIQSMLKPVIRQTMRDCATLPEYAYFATTPGEISQATEMMFRSVMAKARLIN
ncbi:VWA domain-containing protein [Rhabdaerophilum sp. SD176]|uniref:TadE/TadG family type IV pilus assembly protein n=1 Tax=Rhabdaerophilum sp. SD176 TaxID=2983548 RepID=UPI0024DF462F|nr:VWA domain-containing protein [Rhabdaerophilum sp. SD176]